MFGEMVVSEIVPCLFLGAPINLLAASYALENKGFIVSTKLIHEDSS